MKRQFWIITVWCWSSFAMAQLPTIATITVDSQAVANYIRGAVGNNYTEFTTDIVYEGQGVFYKYNNIPYIITCHHIIESANLTYRKAISAVINGKTYFLSLVGGDTIFDIAVLKIKGNPPANINYAKFSQKPLKINDFLFANRNENPKTTINVKGMLKSPTDTRFTYYKTYMSDVIEAGDSGTPIFNKKGKVTGIITRKYQKNDSIVLILPSDYAERFIQDIINSVSETTLGRVQRVFLGWRLYQSTITAPIYIKGILPNSPLTTTDMSIGETLQSINNISVTTLKDAQEVLQALSPNVIINISTKKVNTSKTYSVMSSTMTNSHLVAITNDFFNHHILGNPIAQEYRQYKFSLKNNDGETDCYLFGYKTKKDIESENYIRFAGRGVGFSYKYNISSKKDMGIIIRYNMLEIGTINLYVLEKIRTPKYRAEHKVMSLSIQNAANHLPKLLYY